MRNFFVLLTLLAAVGAVPTLDTAEKNAATLQAKKRFKNLVPNYSTGRVALLRAIDAQRSRADAIAQLKTVHRNERSAGHPVSKKPSALISSLSGAIRSPHKHNFVLSKDLGKALFITPKIDRTADNKRPVWFTVSREGLTGDRCSTSSDCVGDRTCFDINTEAVCNGGSQCLCVPPNLIACSSDADCPSGEGCRELNSGFYCVSFTAGGGGGGSSGSGGSNGGGGGGSGGGTSGQNTAGGGGSGGPAGSGSANSNACVDARALSHLSQNELVFKQHTMANVLCDSDESCATAGHIVAYKGSAMRMSSYCAIVGCSRQRMLVNSPSYRRGMRVASKTKDLDFTAFAARYNTRAEEVFLTAAVHIGL